MSDNKIMLVEFDNIKVSITNPDVYYKIQRMILRLTGARKKQAHPRKSWTEDETRKVVQWIQDGKTVAFMADQLNRGYAAVNIFVKRVKGEFGSTPAHLKPQPQEKQEFVV